MAGAQLARRYEVLTGGSAGEVHIGFPHFLNPGTKATPDGDVTLLYRESDGARADRTEPWSGLRELPGRVRIVFDAAAQVWVAAGPRSRPRSRAKRFHPVR